MSRVGRSHLAFLLCTASLWLAICALPTRCLKAHDGLVLEASFTPTEERAFDRIQAALSQSTDVDLPERTLEQVKLFLEEKGIPATIDFPALETLGLGFDTIVFLRLDDVEIRSALRQMLKGLELTWIIRNELLVITTQEQAEADMRVRIYNVSNLLSKVELELDNGQTKTGFDLDSLIELIQVSIESDSWDVVGGPGTIVGVEFQGVPALVFSQTDETHEKVELFIRKLHELAGVETPTAKLQGIANSPDEKILP